MNPHLKDLDDDFLYHLGYSKSDGLDVLFGDVKFALVGGSGGRMRKVADALAEEFHLSEEEKKQIDISRTDRFLFYKVGPILSVSHGMGVPSISILLHELIKLLKYANARDPIIIRLGTCGGIGIPPGTVVVSNKVFNAYLKSEHITMILGKPVARPAELDLKVAEEIYECGKDCDFQPMLGGTLCTDDFYEGQARVDGAVCDFTEQDRVDYLKTLQQAGVVNIEMECTVLASLCSKTGVKGAICCVSLVDRLQGDQVAISTETYKKYQDRPRTLLLKFLRKRLQKEKHPFGSK